MSKNNNKINVMDLTIKECSQICFKTKNCNVCPIERICRTSFGHIERMYSNMEINKEEVNVRINR